jgi:thiopurine S-methyltransferase
MITNHLKKAWSVVTAVAIGGAAMSHAQAAESSRLDSWIARWTNSSGAKIGWHKFQPNEILVKHEKNFLGESKKHTVLVPLCGKSVDLTYMADHGHTVVGVEGVKEAIEMFSDESGESLLLDNYNNWFLGHGTRATGALAIVNGDYLTQTEEDMKLLLKTINPQIDCSNGAFARVWDRASLVAIEPSDRQKYAEVTSSLMQDGGKMLLCTFEYDSTKRSGPPYSVPLDEVTRLYAPHGMTIEVLERRRAPENQGTLKVLGNELFSCQFLLTKEKTTNEL